MNTITLYHNPRCSKSRQALALLRERDVEPRLRLYLEEPPTKTELYSLLKKLGLGPRDLLRTGEEAYRRLGLADTSLTADQLIHAMIEEPKLLQRPIAVCGEQAVVGRPPEDVLELL